MNFTTLLQNYQEKSGQQYNDLNTFIARAILYVIQQIFLKSAPSFVLTLSCRNDHTCNFYNDLLEKLFGMWNNSVLQMVNVLQQHKNQHIPGKRLHNLILTDSYQAFLDIDVISYTKNYNINEFYYIFLQIRDHLIPREMQQILEFCWKHHIINCSVQIQTALGEIFVYTYFPYTSQYCGQVVPVLINHFKNGSFAEPKNIFPHKLNNFYGCALKAAMWHVPPFVYLKTLKNNNKTIIAGGIEGILLKELATKLNFSIEILIPPNDEQRGKIIDNKTTGALRMLMERTADFSLGCFRRSAERDSIATSSFGYYIVKQVVCINNAVYGLTSWNILTFPFQIETWLFIFFIFLLGLLQIGFVNRAYLKYPHLFPKHNPRHSYLNGFLIFIGMPATRMPLDFRARFFLLNWLFFTLRIPESFDELVDRNYTAVMNIGTYETMLDVTFIQQLRKIIMKTSNETVAFSYIENMHEKRFAAVGPLIYLLHYGRMRKVLHTFKVLPQHVMSFQITIYMTKHSYLIDQFNEKLSLMRAMGLVDIWLRTDFDYRYFKGNFLNVKQTVYGLKELYMLFVIYCIGLLSAGVIFMCEMLSRKIQFLKTIFGKI